MLTYKCNCIHEEYMSTCMPCERGYCAFHQKGVVHSLLINAILYNVCLLQLYEHSMKT